MLRRHRVQLRRLVEGFFETPEPFLSSGFINNERQVPRTHHRSPVTLLEQVWSAEEEDEHGSVLLRGFDQVLLTLGEHVRDRGLCESAVERVEHAVDFGFAHCFVDGGGDSVGLGWAVRWGVDRAVAWSCGVCVEDVHR